MNPVIETLLSAARLAPSADNMQPWRFVIAPSGGRVTIHFDEKRSPAPENVDEQRMARIAVGAVLENVLRTARKNGWPVELLPPPPGAVAAFACPATGAGPGEVEEVLSRRATNRRPGDPRPISPDTLERLRKETPDLEGGVRTHWIVEREQVEQYALLIGRADALRFGNRFFRDALLAKVRFDAPARARVETGFSLGSLELGLLDRAAMRLLPRLPERLLRWARIGNVFAAKAREQVSRSSGLCRIDAPGDNHAIDLLVGRAMQRAWLALTAEGLAVQPMMSLFGLEDVLRTGRPELLSAQEREQIETLLRDFAALGSIPDGHRPATLLRFGFAPAPTALTGRLPLRVLVTEARSGQGGAIPFVAPEGGV
jgi:nitroreductase